MSGTEPKFKIYYNLYGETHNKVLEYFKNVRLILNKMLEG
jgi:phosphomannomutase